MIRRVLTLQQSYWLAIFLYCGFVLNLGHVPLFDLDEGAFSEATREMIDTNIWSATYMDGQPRYDKPILTYWVQAASVSLFGLNEFALRLHSMTFALLWAAGLYFFCREFIDRRSAQAAVMLFSSTLLITIIGRAATADAILNTFIAFTFFDIYRYSQSGRKLHLYRTWLWLSLGMLTKGPVAAGIPLLASGIWFFSIKQTKPWLKAIFSPVGWLILALILLPWLYSIWQEQGSDFFYHFLVDQNFNRFTATREGHGGHWYYYLVALPLGLLPFPGMLVSVIARVKALWSRPLERLLLLWFAVVFVLVSMSKTQLPHYMLYGVTPLLILFAKYRQLFRRQYWQFLFPLLFFALQFALYFYVNHASGPGTDNPYYQALWELAREQMNVHYAIATAIALAAVVVILLSRHSLWKKLVLAGLVQVLFCFLYFVPMIAAVQQQPVKRAALAAKDIKEPFVAYKIDMPSFSVYRRAITQRHPVEWGDYVYTRIDRLPALQKKFGSDHIHVFYQYGGIVLAKVDGM